tara:strand:+ start:628 stop:783 length:156 start_codon:yes stop_codon:yes gene_type:complete
VVEVALVALVRLEHYHVVRLEEQVVLEHQVQLQDQMLIMVVAAELELEVVA